MCYNEEVILFTFKCRDRHCEVMADLHTEHRMNVMAGNKKQKKTILRAIPYGCGGDIKQGSKPQS